MRYALLLSYDGTDFAGWQIQPGKRTVQGTIEEAAERLFGRRTKVTGSGRTDSGVHALGQVAHFDAETAVPPEKLALCLNRLLPHDVRALQSVETADDFDCSRAAKRKTYRYDAYYFPTELPLLERYAVRLSKALDPERMREAARLVLGEHDFAAFRSAGFSSKTSVREIYRADIETKTEGELTFYRIRVEGNGFLYNMVRILCGELFAVGCGKAEGITRALETGERRELAKTMPARGLCLERVEYANRIFENDQAIGRIQRSKGGTYGIF